MLFLHPAQIAFQFVLEDIGEGDEIDILGALHQVNDGLAAASSAADETGFELLLAGSADEFGADDLECGGSGSRVAKEGPAGQVIFSRFHEGSLTMSVVIFYSAASARVEARAAGAVPFAPR